LSGWRKLFPVVQPKRGQPPNEEAVPGRLLSLSGPFLIWPKRLVASCQSPVSAALKNASNSEGGLFPSCLASTRA